MTAMIVTYASPRGHAVSLTCARTTRAALDRAMTALRANYRDHAQDDGEERPDSDLSDDVAAATVDYAQRLGHLWLLAALAGVDRQLSAAEWIRGLARVSPREECMLLQALEYLDA